MKHARSTYVSHVLDNYLDSADFQVRAQTVRLEYARIAHHLHNEIGSWRVADISRASIRQLRNDWAYRGHRAATMRLQVLKNALEPHISDGVLQADLFLRLQRVDRPHNQPEQNEVWTDREVGAVIDACIASNAGGLARAIALARYAGLRRQAVCGLQTTDRVKAADDGGAPQRRIRYISEKGEQAVDVIEDRRLTCILEDRTLSEGDFVAYNKRSEPWKPRQLNQALDRLLEKLTKAGVLNRKLTLHGLRHTRGVELAYAGASDAELAAQLGHSDEQTAKEYRRQALRRKLADRAQQLVDARMARPTPPLSKQGPHFDEPF